MKRLVWSLLLLSACGTRDRPGSLGTGSEALECAGDGTLLRHDNNQERGGFLVGRWVTCEATEPPLFAVDHGAPGWTLAEGVEFIQTSSSAIVGGTWRLLTLAGTGYQPLSGARAEGDWDFFSPEDSQLNITYATGSYNPTRAAFETGPDFISFEYFGGRYRIGRLPE